MCIKKGDGQEKEEIFRQCLRGTYTRGGGSQEKFQYYKPHCLKKIKERKNHLLRILNITDWFLKNIHFSLVLYMHFYIQKFVSFTLKLPDESVGMEQS